jgi:hypothetical protein
MPEPSEIAIVTAWTAEFNELASYTFPTVREYAKRHGYRAFGGCVDKPTDRHFDWCRMDTVASYLERFNVVMWIDADALIMDASHTIENLIGPDLRRLVVNADFNGLNSGVFIARAAPEVKRFFYALRGYYVMFKNHWWQAQAAMIQLLSAPPYDTLASYVPQPVMNSYINALHGWPDFIDGNYERGDWIVHLAGVPMATRLEWLKLHAPRFENG